LAGNDLASAIETERGTGENLEAGARGTLETTLGLDLAGVRVHTDPRADVLTRSLGAVAFTTGSDIFFRAGAYAPTSHEGMRVLAHEAAHIVQQAAGPVPGTLTADGSLRISDPSDEFEQQAEHEAESIATPNQPAVDPHPLTTSSTPRVPSVQRIRFMPDWLREFEPGDYVLEKYLQNPAHPRWYPKPPPSTPPGFEGQPQPYPPNTTPESPDFLEPSPESAPDPYSPEPAWEPGAPDPGPPAQQPWQGPPEGWEGPETLRSPGTGAGEAGVEGGEAAEATEVAEAAEAGTEATELVEATEVVELAEGAEAGLGAAEAAGGLGAAELGLLGLAGYAGYKTGEFIGEEVIDPYLNRPHAEAIDEETLAKEQEQIHDPTITNYAETMDESYKDTWAYKINEWLED
jgi:hypothetical protein